MVIPPAVLILPLFLGIQPLGLTNTYQGVVLIYTGMLVPFSVYMLSSFFRTLPAELFEAARIDGASTLRILRSIVVPLSGPGFVTLIVVNAMWVWNELLIALVFLQDDQKRTLMAGLTTLRGRYADQRAPGHGGHVPRRAADPAAVPVRAALLRPRPRRRRGEVGPSSARPGDRAVRDRAAGRPTYPAASRSRRSRTRRSGPPVRAGDEAGVVAGDRADDVRPAGAVEGGGDRVRGARAG